MYVLCCNKSIISKIQPRWQEVITVVAALTSCHLSWAFKDEIADKVASGLLPQQQGAFSSASPEHSVQLLPYIPVVFFP